MIQAKEAASQPEAFRALKEVGDLSNEGIIIFSIPNENFIYSNDIANRLLRLKTDIELVDVDDLLKSVYPPDREYLEYHYLLVRRNHTSKEIEFRIGGNEAEPVFVCCNAYLVLNEAYIVFSLRDISKAKQHENYLIEFGTKKNTMLDTLVHHISGVLLLMKNLSLEAEKSIGSDPNRLQNYLALVRNNSIHCIDMINDLLNEEHSKAPGVNIKTVRINVVEKVRFVFDTLKESYTRKFNFTCTSPVILVVTDEFKLLQIINNLTSNAVKFTPDDGEISIHIAEEREGVTISVSDTGIGISDALKPFVFDHSTLTGRQGLRGERSRGLGLYISQQLTGIIHGKLTFDSKENEGTTFTLWLPYTAS